jgi:hypothetical protein
MKKSLSILLMLLLTLPGACILSAQVIHVDIANTTGIEDGTEAHPFNTIRKGINAAAPGNQVMIRKGTYVPDDSWSGNPHTLLLKAGVSLVGESRDNTIIAGIVVDQQASNLSTGLEKLRFDEYYFVRATHAGPFSDRNIIRECATGYIDLAYGAGIPVNDTTPGPNFGFLIEDNDLGTEGSIEFKQGAGVSLLTVTGNSCGYIQLLSGGGYTYVIDHNDIQFGILDASGTNATTISNNTILNGAIIDRSGGNQYGAEDQIIEHNSINADEGSPVFIDEIHKAGISSSARSGTIRNNTITCTGKVHGIFSNAGPPLNLMNNQITLDEIQTPSPDPLEEGRIGILTSSGWGYVSGNTIHGGEIGYYTKSGAVEFAYNTIEKSYTGFFGNGAENVHHNIIRECYGDGMIMNGQKGPLSYNMVVNNGGSGIRIIKTPIDLGGGEDNSPGKNTIKGNGNFNLYLESVNNLHPVLYARNNIWDHDDAGQIAQLDIRDGSDSAGLVTVDFTPWGGLGVGDPEQAGGLAVYPNPAGGMVTIEGRWAIGDLRSATGMRGVVKIYDSMGHEVITLKEIAFLEGKYRITFDASFLPAGLYHCRLEAGEVMRTCTLIKNR